MNEALSCGGGKNVDGRGGGIDGAARFDGGIVAHGEGEWGLFIGS